MSSPAHWYMIVLRGRVYDYEAPDDWYDGDQKRDLAVPCN